MTATENKIFDGFVSNVSGDKKAVDKVDVDKTLNTFDLPKDLLSNFTKKEL